MIFKWTYLVKNFTVFTSLRQMLGIIMTSYSDPISRDFDQSISCGLLISNIHWKFCNKAELFEDTDFATQNHKHEKSFYI